MACGTRPFKRAGAAQRAARAGFTLVELMVAMTGGLFLSIVVFALSRDASRFYQQETRVANATLSGVTGFERLFNDIARAGHLVTPNIDLDPRVCNRPQASWPDRIEDLRALVINAASTDTAATEVGQAGLKPMVIELAGALDVTEELTIAQVGPGATANEIYIRLDTPAAARLGLNDAAAVEDNVARLKALLMPDGNARAVRITQLDGMEQYAKVADVTAEPTLRITLATQPALKFRSDDPKAAECGIQGFNTGGSLSVVNFVRYELKSLVSDSNYADLYKASQVDGGLPYESGRVELTRVELSPEGTAIESTREIVSEYAVDLQFSLIRAASATDATLVEDPAANANSEYATQLLRGVHARLSVRSREADRSADVSGMGGASTGLYRMPLALGAAGAPPYARVRTFQSYIPLRNLEGTQW